MYILFAYTNQYVRVHDITRLFQVPDLGRYAMPVPETLYAFTSTSGRSARSGNGRRTDFTGSHVRAHVRAHDRARFD